MNQKFKKYNIINNNKFVKLYCSMIIKFIIMKII